MTVTPCVGVWIEILNFPLYSSSNRVTPCVGVWIEIQYTNTVINGIPSLPAWECGLKYISGSYYFADRGSLPAWECGLK